jgi:plasma kallikrein
MFTIAAHCVFGNTPDSLLARAGEWDTSNKNEQYKDENRDIVDIIIHEEFHSRILIHDVALLIAASPFPTDNPSIGTVCLPPPSHEFAGAQCTLSGWGKQRYSTKETYSYVLKKVEMPVITNADCQTQLRKSILGNYFSLHSTFLCAGEPGKDACIGDGGSPLVSDE